MGELMDEVTKYVESDKTKDGDSEEDKASQGKKSGGKGQHNGNQSQQNKRWLDQNTYDLVANTNVGFQRQKQGGDYRKTDENFRPNSYESAIKGPCPRHSRPGRPANHSWENCNIMQEFKRRGGNGGGHQGPPGSGSGAGYNNNNQQTCHQGAVQLES